MISVFYFHLEWKFFHLEDLTVKLTWSNDFIRDEKQELPMQLKAEIYKETMTKHEGNDKLMENTCNFSTYLQDASASGVLVVILRRTFPLGRKAKKNTDYDHFKHLAQHDRAFFLILR